MQDGLNLNTGQKKTKKRARWGSGSVYRIGSGKRWYISLSIDGVQQTRSTGTEDRKQASDLLDAWRNSVRTGGPDPFRYADVRMGELFDDLLADYSAERRSSIDDQRSRLKNHLRPFFGDRRAADVDNSTVQEYVAKRIAEAACPSTIANEISALKKSFSVALTNRKMVVKPSIKQIKVPDNARQGFCTPAEFERFVAELPEAVAALARVAYSTGMRRGELVNLAWSRLDLDAGMIRLRPEDTKNRRGRNIPLTDECATILRERKRLRDEKYPGFRYVFFHKHHGEVRQLSDFRITWESAAKKVGKPGLLLHDFRRSFCKNSVEAGMPQPVIMACSGHRTVSVFHRYAIVDEDPLRNLADTVEKYVAAKAAEERQRAEQMAAEEKKRAEQFVFETTGRRPEAETLTASRVVN
jgi:integrase